MSNFQQVSTQNPLFYLIKCSPVWSKNVKFASIHNMPSLNQGSAFSLQKLNSDSPMFFSIRKKIFEKFSRGWPLPYCVLAPKNLTIATSWEGPLIGCSPPHLAHLCFVTCAYLHLTLKQILYKFNTVLF